MKIELDFLAVLARWPLLIKGVVWTLALAALSAVLGGIVVIKGTALASIIGFIEITKTGTMITNATFKPFLVYSFVALFYFALCFPLSWWSKRLELRMALAERLGGLDRMLP